MLSHDPNPYIKTNISAQPISHLGPRQDHFVGDVCIGKGRVGPPLLGNEFLIIIREATSDGPTPEVTDADIGRPVVSPCQLHLQKT